MEKFKLDFTKLLDVKSPIGIEQREKIDDSIGIDLYMPRPSLFFFEKIRDANQKYFNNSLHIDVEENVGFTIFINNNKKLLIYNKFDGYNIYDNITIPTGIAIDLPKGFHLVNRSKSSNFKNYYTSIEGLIDNNYTYGFGLQLQKLNNNEVIIQPDEKISQILLEKSYPIVELNELTNDKWDSSVTIQNKRNQRTGGFGSTGKF